MTKIKNWTLSKVAAVQARNSNEEGQGLAEYGLILALIAVVCIIALRALGLGVQGQLQAVVAGL